MQLNCKYCNREYKRFEDFADEKTIMFNKGFLIKYFGWKCKECGHKEQVHLVYKPGQTLKCPKCDGENFDVTIPADVWDSDLDLSLVYDEMKCRDCGEIQKDIILNYKLYTIRRMQRCPNITDIPIVSETEAYNNLHLRLDRLTEMFNRLTGFSDRPLLPVHIERYMDDFEFIKILLLTKMDAKAYAEHLKEHRESQYKYWD